MLVNEHLYEPVFSESRTKILQLYNIYPNIYSYKPMLVMGILIIPYYLVLCMKAYYFSELQLGYPNSVTGVYVSHKYASESTFNSGKT